MLNSLKKYFFKPNKVPKHIAVIMDGNGRWATARGLERLKGHVKGVERVREVIRASPTFGIGWLTLFAFSTENWKRSEVEVTGLMKLFKRYIRAEAATLDEENVRVCFIMPAMRNGLDLWTDLLKGILHSVCHPSASGKTRVLVRLDHERFLRPVFTETEELTWLPVRHAKVPADIENL